MPDEPKERIVLDYSSPREEENRVEREEHDRREKLRLYNLSMFESAREALGPLLLAGIIAFVITVGIFPRSWAVWIAIWVVSAVAIFRQAQASKWR
jgi:hypothetical protein